MKVRKMHWKKSAIESSGLAIKMSSFFFFYTLDQ